MSVPAPHFLLHSRTRQRQDQSCWSFSLEAADQSVSLAVEDAEPDAAGERLELLAVVRGLEAIPSPSRVTLVTSSNYVNRVLDGGLDEWRTNGWKWERHGEMVPVKNHDLWRRVDRALRFHQLHARRFRFDASHAPVSVRTTAPHRQALATNAASRCSNSHNDNRPSRFRPPVRLSLAIKTRARKLLVACAIGRRRARRFARRLESGLAELGKSLAPCA